VLAGLLRKFLSANSRQLGAALGTKDSARSGDAIWFETEKHYRRMLAQQPSNAVAQFELAKVLRLQGRVVEAARACARACILDPSLPGIGSALFEHFEYLREQDLDATPEATADWISHLALANTALDEQDFDFASVCLNNARNTDPGWGHIDIRAGCIAALAGRWLDADADFATAATRGMPPAPYIRLAPAFLATLDVPPTANESSVDQVQQHDSIKVTLFAACDPLYFRRFGAALVQSLSRNAGIDFLFHLHIINPDAWVEDEAARLPVGGWLKRLDISTEQRDFASAKAAKTWYACARLMRVSALLDHHRLPVVMLDLDILALSSLVPLLDLARDKDAALLQWSAGKWQIWDQISASTVVYQPSPGGRRFAAMAAQYVAHFIDRPEGAWYLDQIALFAAHAYLRPRGVQFALIPPATYALHGEAQRPSHAGTMFYSITANIERNAQAQLAPLFQSFLPEIRNAFGWSLPGTDHFFFEQWARAPEENGRKRWDLELMRFCEKHFPSSRRRAIDIGAGAGFWSEWLATKFTHVDAFEPHPLMQRCFAENVPQRNVTLHRDALGAEKISAGGALKFDDVDFIKMDTEGFEALVQHGGLDTLRRNKPLTLIKTTSHADRDYPHQIAENSAAEIMTSLGASLIASPSDDNLLYVWPR
jgi:hypothetical protein